MMRAAACLAVLVLALAPPGASSRAPSEAVVHGWVEDAEGAVLLRLQPSDFEIAVDGTAVAVQSATPRAASMSIVILVDVSRSVGWEARPLGEEQMAAFTESLNAEDRVMIATCCGKTTVGQFRAAREDLRDDLRRALEIADDEGFGGSPIWDAMYDSVTILSRQPAPRALILLSDGRASANRYGLEDVADHALAHGVSLNILARPSAQRIYQSGSAAILVRPAAPLDGLARYTGGFLFAYPDGQNEARTTLGIAGSVLRGLQAFRFTPPVSDGQSHRLEIRSRTPGVKVHAPTAFVAN